MCRHWYCFAPSTWQGRWETGSIIFSLLWGAKPSLKLSFCVQAFPEIFFHRNSVFSPPLFLCTTETLTVIFTSHHELSGDQKASQLLCLEGASLLYQRLNKLPHFLLFVWHFQCDKLPQPCLTQKTLPPAAWHRGCSEHPPSPGLCLQRAHNNSQGYVLRRHRKSFLPRERSHITGSAVLPGWRIHHPDSLAQRCWWGHRGSIMGWHSCQQGLAWRHSQVLFLVSQLKSSVQFHSSGRPVHAA